MKRILVPTDFSEHAYAAAEVAADIAKRTDARVYLLHVVNLLEYGDENEISKQLFVMRLVRQRMEKLVKQPFFEGVNVVEALSFDRVYENVAKKANEHEIDLIVMGTHGAGAFKELIYGSNAQKIVRLANCPVLTIKEKPRSFEFKNVVFTSNFDTEVETSLLQVQQFADVYDAKIHLLRVCTSYDFAGTADIRAKMKEVANDCGLKDYTMNIYNDQSLEAGIRKFTESVNGDLTAIATHGRDGLGHILFGSRAEDLVNHESMPILSVRMNK